MKKIYYITIALISLIAGCKENNFFDFKNEDISYQLLVGKDDILRITRTNGNGAYSLQLLSVEGDVIEDKTIATPYSLEISSCKLNTLTLRYFVNKSDSSIFARWIKKEKFNPGKIGKYKISYSCKIYDQSSDIHVEYIDSISFAKNAGAVLFLNKKQVATVPANELYVYEKEFREYIDEKNLCIIYRPKTKNLVKDYLKSILKSFNAKS